MSLNTIEIRPDDPSDPTLNLKIRNVDEIVISNWFHLERMNGINKREWALIITNEKRECLNIYLSEKDGIITQATIVENSWSEE
jgi:DNA-binding winged helix-turn-helix (wHTH) protein